MAETDRILAHFQRNISFYQYYRTKATYLDHKYFLRSETLRMRDLGSAQPEQTIAEHRAVVEMLAGMPYDCLWGNNNIGYLNRHKPAAPGLTQGGALNSTYTRG